MSKKLAKFWPIIFLCLLTFILRVVNIEQLFYFTYDEAIPAFVGRRIILWQHVPLIGGVTPFGFHLAPYFYWFYTVLLYFGKLNPIIWGWAGAAIATITTLLMYKVGTLTGSRKIGFTAAVFWAFSFLANLYDRHLWALYWAPLFSLIVLLSLYKIIRGNQKFVYLLGASIALSIHADPSNLVFLLLSSIVWFIYKIPIKKSTLVAIALIFLSFAPLVVFDLKHNFANTKPVLVFAKAGNNNPGFHAQKFLDNTILFPRTFTRLAYTFGDNQVAKQYSYCRNYVSEKFNAIPSIFILFSSLAILSFIFWAFFKTRRNRIDDSKNISYLVTLLIISYFLGIQIYGTFFKADIFEHYITGIFPCFLIILSILVSYLPKKLWIAALAIFVGLNLYKLSLARNDLGLTAKRQAIEYTMQQMGDDRPFSLDSLSTCWKLSGYRYLFIVFGREPIKSYVDPNLSYLYGTTAVAEKHPQTVVSFVAHDFAPETDEFYSRYALLKSHEVNSALFGKIEVVILNNSTGWFDQPLERVRPNIPNGVD